MSTDQPEGRSETDNRSEFDHLIWPDSEISPAIPKGRRWASDREPLRLSHGFRDVHFSHLAFAALHVYGQYGGVGSECRGVSGNADRREELEDDNELEIWCSNYDSMNRQHVRLRSVSPLSPILI